MSSVTSILKRPLERISIGEFAKALRGAAHKDPALKAKMASDGIKNGQVSVSHLKANLTGDVFDPSGRITDIPEEFKGKTVGQFIEELIRFVS